MPNMFLYFFAFQVSVLAAAMGLGVKWQLEQARYDRLGKEWGTGAHKNFYVAENPTHIYH